MAVAMETIISGGDVDIVHPLPVHLHDLVPVAGSNTGIDQAAVLVQRLRRLSDDIIVLLIGSHISDLLRNPAGFLLHARGRGPQ